MTSLSSLITLSLLLSLPVRSLPLDDEYQYDDPADEVNNKEEEVAATFNIEMITKRTEFRVRPGDKLALPCELQSTGDVERIWSRPDQSSSQIISVGSSILDPEQASLFALESDGTLIILSASPALEGAYQCRIATQVSKEVTHSVKIVPDMVSDSKMVLSKIHGLSSGSSPLPSLLNLTITVTLLCLHRF